MGDPEALEICFFGPRALDDPARRAATLALLSSDELERMARFHFQRDRQLFLAARALLRRSLSRCQAGVLPEAWRFGANAHGRPEIVAPESPLRFNVSHTRGLAMVAVVDARDVGADVERLPAVVPFDVVDRSFTAVEREAVRAAPAGEQAARFTELWTLKEAYAKARGLGLSLPFDRFAFELGPPRLVLGDDPGAWQVELLAPTAEHRAAVCVHIADRPLPIVVRWEDE